MVIWICEIELITKKVHDGYIIFVKGREAHAHFKHRSGCLALEKMIGKRRKPTKKYFLVAAQRILNDEELGELKESHNHKYINRKRG
jgi:hypothetical protein